MSNVANTEMKADAVIEKAEPMSSAQSSKLVGLLRDKFAPLYAVLDAARDTRVLSALLASNSRYQSLYEGPHGAALAQFAPYLVSLEREDPLLDVIIREGWGNSWGVYISCLDGFEKLRYHLRRFLEVSLPGGKQAYFRFYDPRVLRLYLPTLNADEVRSFFGPIRFFLVERKDPERLAEFSVGESGIACTDLLWSRQ